MLIGKWKEEIWHETDSHGAFFSRERERDIYIYIYIIIYSFERRWPTDPLIEETHSTVPIACKSQTFHMLESSFSCRLLLIISMKRWNAAKNLVPSWLTDSGLPVAPSFSKNHILVANRNTTSQTVKCSGHHKDATRGIPNSCHACVTCAGACL